MAQPWITLEEVETADGPIALKQRGHDFLITLSGRALMSTMSTRSEEALSKLGCAALATQRAPRVLIGGLGLGFTLRAALDCLPFDAEVTVAELSEIVATWCRGPAALPSCRALEDPRVTVIIEDVARVISGTERWDAILLDLYEGPNTATQGPNDRFYGAAALKRTSAALRPKGTFAVWSEEPDSKFMRRLKQAGFLNVEQKRHGRGARGHVTYLARRSA